MCQEGVLDVGTNMKRGRDGCNFVWRVKVVCLDGGCNCAEL